MLRARVQPLETKIPQAVQPNEEGGETGGGERSRGDSENHWHTTISAVPSSRPVSVRGEPAKARAMRPSAPFLPGSSYQESPPAPFLPSSRPFLSGERRPAPFLPALPVAVSLQGYAGATHWKVYIMARGIQPLVVCDGTTLSEL